jgi:hypothetical protein
MLKVGHQLNKRDRKGWRIPRPGTLSRKIYEMINSGMTPKEISEALDENVGKIRVLSHRFRNA